MLLPLASVFQPQNSWTCFEQIKMYFNLYQSLNLYFMWHCTCIQTCTCTYLYLYSDPVLLSALSGELIKIKAVPLYFYKHIQVQFKYIYVLVFRLVLVSGVCGALSGEIIKIKAVQLKPAQARQTWTATEKEEILMLHTWNTKYKYRRRKP